jgi:hypothetical protein
MCPARGVPCLTVLRGVVAVRAQRVSRQSRLRRRLYRSSSVTSVPAWERRTFPGCAPWLRTLTVSIARIGGLCRLEPRLSLGAKERHDARGAGRLSGSLVGLHGLHWATAASESHAGCCRCLGAGSTCAMCEQSWAWSWTVYRRSSTLATTTSPEVPGSLEGPYAIVLLLAPASRSCSEVDPGANDELQQRIQFDA